MSHAPGIIFGMLAAWALAAAGTTAIEPDPAPVSILLVLYVSLTVVGLLGSMAFSGLETATYAMSRLRLLVRMSRGDAAAARLHHEIINRRRLLSTLLIGNNIANFMLSFGITSILTQVIGLGDWSSVVIQAAILTPLLFVVGETLPKEYGRSHANVLVYRTAGLLRGFRIFSTCIGLLPLVYWLGEGIVILTASRQARKVASARARMVSLFEEGVGYGILTEQQSSLIERALAMRDMTVMDELIPWAKVVTVPEQATPQELHRITSRYSYTRYPVVDSTGSVIGIMTLLDMLAAERETSRSETAGTPAPVPAPPLILEVRLPIQQALAAMREAGVTLAIVANTDAGTSSGTTGKPIGIVTTKDLVEPLIGDIAAG
ncbi:MAG: DUF21 domain-containing protein [Planctomycetes bacterium]|nr:DUF21 domain-containing protein [Planctomycetota bacterium]NOG55174.1 DUF21 domain-containing protein [Planctomycetota bacterium]